jgi:hypothetical protein
MAARTGLGSICQGTDRVPLATHKQLHVNPAKPVFDGLGRFAGECFREAAMSHETKMTRRDERREMQKLMQERKQRTPGRSEPNWVLDFWANRLGERLT